MPLASPLTSVKEEAHLSVLLAKWSLEAQKRTLLNHPLWLVVSATFRS
jgi:hypothetical protein